MVVDPPAQVTFESFGDSSLSFVLRCYISMRDMPYRLDVIDDLHMTTLLAAKIEIAFPQRDLHVRSLTAELPSTSLNNNADGNNAEGTGAGRSAYSARVQAVIRANVD